MLDKFADFLGTDKGFWFTIGLTLLTCVLALIVLDPATFVLSVIAIVLPSIILVRDNHQKQVADKRDDAMHKKLDALIAAIPNAPNDLQEIEKADDPL